MSFTIGRSSFANDPSYLRHDGERLQVGFNILPSTLIEAKVLRQQVLGLANNDDEPVVPMTWSADADYDGFYRVLNANVEPVTKYQSNRLMRCVVDLELVSISPQVETTVGALVRTNSHSITAPSTMLLARHAIQSHAEGASTLAASNRANKTRASEEGDITITVGDAPVDIDSWRYWGDVDAHYTGAARIEVERESTWYEVVGRHPAVDSDTGWRISNGVVRLSSGLGDATSATIEMWDSGLAGWDSFDVGLLEYNGSTEETRSLGGHVSGGVLPWAVLRNASDRVVVQFVNGLYLFSVSIAKGARHVEIAWEQANGAAASPWYGANLGVASTAVTGGGIRATSASSDGNYPVASVAAADTTNLTNGYVYPTSVTASDAVMIGVVDTTTASDANSPESLIDQFLGINPTRVTVVAP